MCATVVVLLSADRQSEVSGNALTGRVYPDPFNVGTSAVSRADIRALTWPEIRGNSIVCVHVFRRSCAGGVTRYLQLSRAAVDYCVVGTAPAEPLPCAVFSQTDWIFF